MKYLHENNFVGTFIFKINYSFPLSMMLKISDFSSDAKMCFKKTGLALLEKIARGGHADIVNYFSSCQNPRVHWT